MLLNDFPASGSPFSSVVIRLAIWPRTRGFSHFRLCRRSAGNSSSSLEGRDFLPVERSDRAGWQVAEADWADGDPPQPLHLVTEPRQKAANFAVAAFVQNHLKQRRRFPPALDSDMLGVGETFRQVNTVMQLTQHFALHLPCHLDLINFLHAVAGMREPVGQLSVVSNEDQPFTGNIEPADAKRARCVGRQQVGDAWPASRVSRGAYYAHRLVHGEIHEVWFVQQFAVDADFLPRWIGARAKLSDNLVINLDAPIEDELLAFAPAGDAGSRQNFLEAVGCFVEIG
jgi:hypothetical protein